MVKKILPLIPKFVKLVLFLIGALVLDLLLYAFATPCPACTSFGQFVATPLSLSGPIIASLTALLSPLLSKKK